jgi:hypothetical protein
MAGYRARETGASDAGAAMRRLIWVLGVAVLLWGLWWVSGAAAKRATIAGWFEARRTAGWAADYDDLAVTGFPLRFETAMTGILLADPRAQLAWNLPRLEIAMPAWRPTRIALGFPPEQSFATPAGRVEIGSRGLAAGLDLAAEPRLALQAADLSAAGLVVDTPGGTATLEAPRAQIRRIDGAIPRYAVSAGAATLGFDARALARIDPTGRRPPNVATLRLEMTVGFDAPLDLRTIEIARPAVTEIEIADLTGIWGRLELRAAGRVTIDAAGRPDGLIQIKAVNWREMIDQARAAGLLPDSLAAGTERMLGRLAGLAGNPDTLDLPLGFGRGLVWLGPIPLGTAPRIALP